MATRMLIDARHPEETRVAVLKGNRIDEFDFESADRKQIKGNIYLAKVTRVEPSLQAAFVDFGGNRHGFLAFSEIHPDYYQIPQSDREALLAEEAAHAEEEAALRDEEDGDGPLDPGNEDEESAEDGEEEAFDDADQDDEDDDEDGGLTEVETSEKDEVSTIEDGQVENGDEDADAEESDSDEESSSDNNADRGRGRKRGRRRGQRGRSKQADDLRAKRMALRRRYKIQDVIHRRQVLLVQVVKEERGNKGAALTTYLSLAGRYCVLMPNSSHGGGISRKISSVSDRKRLKAIVAEMQLPKTMGCIVRTAGLSRTKTEIKRDFDYLARLWDELRERTLGSSAPTLIHSDSDLIKRAIRDIYNREIEEVVVEGEDGYKAAKSFMKLLMPSHARRVKSYSDPVPLFQRYGAEDQLTAMYDPEVQLKSGGYIVINPTEALVSIDINSGRSTKQHGIEATALNTNLEAAREVARQLRLRDMAGLVVIDFIDMDYNNNVRKVERVMKDALKTDRARIQVGRISSFGLMEMSRQRLRTGVLEATTRECPHCDGTGLVRTSSSAGLSALRLIEDEAAKGKGNVITLHASTEAAVYLLNSKRNELAAIEERYGVTVEVIPEGENEGAKMRIAASGPKPDKVPDFQPIIDDDDDDVDVEELDETSEDEAEEDDSQRRKGRRRRGRGRGGRSKQRDEQVSDSDDEETPDTVTSNDDGEEEAPKKRRRRGGRRRRGRGKDSAAESQVEDQQDGDETADADQDADAPSAEQDGDSKDAEAETVAVDDSEEGEPEEEAKPKARRSRRKKANDDSEQDNAEPKDSVDEARDEAEAPKKPRRTRRKKADDDAGDSTAKEDKPAKPKRTRRKKDDPPAIASETEGGQDTATEAPELVAQSNSTESKAASSDPVTSAASDGEPRRGWWQRTFGE